MLSRLLHQIARNPLQALARLVQTFFLIPDNRFALSQTAGLRCRIALDANWLEGFVDGFLDCSGIEADDHAGEVVGAEAGEGVLDEGFGCGLGVLDVADEVNGFLVGADVPEL